MTTHDASIADASHPGTTTKGRSIVLASLCFGAAAIDVAVVVAIVGYMRTLSMDPIGACAAIAVVTGLLIASFLLFLRSRPIAATTALVSGVAFAVFFESAMALVSNFGVDTFEEATSFSKEDLVFWLTTIGHVFVPTFRADVMLASSLLALSVVVPTMTWRALTWGQSRMRSRRLAGFGLAFCTPAVLAGILVLGRSAIVVAIMGSTSYIQIRENFSDVPRIAAAAKDDGTKVVVYVGESTSSMDMGLYGYVRDTTPELARLADEDDGFLQFRNVVSTHTHTAPSLLEALSFGVGRDPGVVPPLEAPRVSMVDVFAAAGVPTVLYSNQGRTGTWNMASTIIFKSAKRHFSDGSLAEGNDDSSTGRPWDHDWYARMKADPAFSASNKSLFVFHSQAGHGNYLDRIPPEFRGRVDDKFAFADPKAMVGEVVGFPQYEEYDSAVRYVDHSVAGAVSSVAASEKPAILVYFSDHGESAFTGRGHDSSRFMLEMMRIPFVVYFNHAARERNSDLFEKYRRLSESRHLSSLAQLPSTLMDLLGIEIRSSSREIRIVPPVGSLYDVPAILRRENDSGISAIDLDSPLPEGVVDATTSLAGTTAIYSARLRSTGAEMWCYHRSNTVAKAIRGALAAQCLEFDVVAEPDGRVVVRHPPAPDTGLEIAMVMDIAMARDRKVWIDAKNIGSASSCGVLADSLDAMPGKNVGGLVEFPSEALDAVEDLVPCVARIRKAGFRTGYYLPTADAVFCSGSMAEGASFESVDACRITRKTYERAGASGIFDDIDFDYAAVGAVRAIDPTGRFLWNVWNVTAVQQVEPSIGRFGMVIMPNSDPNNM